MKKKKREDKLYELKLIDSGLYEVVCDLIRSRSNKDGTINKKELDRLLGIMFHVPKSYKNKVISDFINSDFLELTHRSDDDNRKIFYKILS